MLIPIYLQLAKIAQDMGLPRGSGQFTVCSSAIKMEKMWYNTWTTTRGNPSSSFLN